MTTAEIALIGRDAKTLGRIASLGLGSLSTFCEAASLNQQGNVLCAEAIARELVDQGQAGMRAKALVLLAGNLWSSDPDGALVLYKKAEAFADDPCTALTIVKMRAVVLSGYGDHRRALRELENAACLLNSIAPIPPARDDFLNSLAVELKHAGRLRESAKLCDITTASPWVRCFPEWTETAESLRLILPDRGSVTISTPHRASVLAFPDIYENAATRLATLRLQAFLAINRIGDEPLLTCIARFISLPGPNRELIIRAPSIAPALAQRFLDHADKHDSFEGSPWKKRSEGNE